jgi:tetratricopeptide (TPR) repeat protein
LRPFLSSKEMLIVLDNAESILDPQGTDAREIYAAVEELSQFSNICLCITSRIATLPSDCETLDIPTLSIEAARDTFHRIYKNVERSDLVSNILEQLDFHPLSITLFATVAHHNKWDVDRLTREWKIRRTGLLHTQHNKSLAAAIELSLASPTFQELGPHARDLLGVVAFFPQGIDDNNLEWLFPTISNRRDIFDKFCVLSLTYRSGSFTTMLAPLRDCLCPEDPTSSPLLCATKECYFGRLSIYTEPDWPGFEETRWITSDDVNVEHLLDVFTSIDENSDNIWDACACFMEHLCWHKRRLVVLGPKLEGLPDGQPSKPKCLLHLSLLFYSVGNYAECKRLLMYALKLWKERGNNFWVAQTLTYLASANEQLLLPEEGIQLVKEALEILEPLNEVRQQAASLQQLAQLLCKDNQFDTAEDAATLSINLLPDSEQFAACQGYRILGDICRSKGGTEQAINHYSTALGIADSFNWRGEQCWIHLSLAMAFRDQDRFSDAHTHVERARSYADNGSHNLGHAIELEATIWHKQGRFEEAKAEILCAIGVYEKLGAVTDAEWCRNYLWDFERGAGKPITSGGSDSDGELPETVLPPTSDNSPSSARGTK